MKKKVFICALFFLFTVVPSHLWASAGEWREGFERICARTADAGALSSEELSGLIDDSAELLKVIEAQPAAETKIYLLRLKKCRNFFIFMRDTLINGEEP